MKLYLDPGHGGSDTGAQGNGMNEKDINLDISLRIRTMLTKQYHDADVTMSRTDDSSKRLSERTDEANAWGADYYLSIHCNSFNGSAQGYEDYIHSSLSDTSATADYQDTIHTAVAKADQLADRGQKKANFHVLRETTMPALLTENGFIDNDHDAALMRDSSWRHDVAQAHVTGLANAFHLKPRKTSKTLYKVIAGSFKDNQNAENRVYHLQSEGMDAFVEAVTISGERWYRVQAGAFSNRENAERQLEKVKNAGIADAFITAE
ncbi:sporulation-specific N-acetylmuramoyl-L-alanine amidase [Lentibacillus halophilus]|uniref:Sporulation-specific N-acetylmuramoyl-L-alanine amidase n=1 Tax=Lentibacillus halophilus TaxID=295065 RepID=A0ABN0Z184_9BACI